jgi:hypothetical protein
MADDLRDHAAPPAPGRDRRAYRAARARIEGARCVAAAAAHTPARSRW